MPPSTKTSTSTRSPSRWNGLSPDERKRERRRLLIDAAFELLATEGAAGTTVRAVCAKARLNPRYFYESFEELDELLVAVYDDVMRSMNNQIRERHREIEPDLASSVRATVEAAIRFIDEDRRRGRIMYAEALGNEALNKRRIRAGFELVDAVTQSTRRHRGSRELAVVDHLTATALVGGFSEMLAAWLDGRIDIDADELIDQASELFVTLAETANVMSSRS